jgi:membrane associated rhomboid family serine protease
MYSPWRYHRGALPLVTIALLAINFAVFMLVFASPNPDGLLSEYGEHPAVIARGEDLHTIFTSMFLHVDIIHLLGNMLYLAVFGALVEQRLGHFRFILLYLVAGVGAVLFMNWVALSHYHVGAEVFGLGASGAIGGLMGACLLGFPLARIPSLFLWIFLWFLTPLMGFWVFLISGILFLAIIVYTINIKIPAIVFLLLWFVEQFWLMTAAVHPSAWAHLGGVLVGGLLYLVMRKKEAFRERQDDTEIGDWETIRASHT